MQNALWCRDLVPRESLIKKQKQKQNITTKDPEAERRQSPEGWEGLGSALRCSQVRRSPHSSQASFISAHLGLDHGFYHSSFKELGPWSYWPEMIQKPWQVTAQKTSLAFVPTALGGGRKTDGETVWETGRIPGERDKGGKKRTRPQMGVRRQRWQCHRPA